MSVYKNLVVPFLRKSLVYNQSSWIAVAYFGSKIEVPTPPKRPLTAYMIYCKENRKNLLKENPSLSSPEQIKVLAEKWSHLTTDMKKPYEISARESTLLYGELHKKFYENLTEEQKEELIRRKAEKKESRRMLRLKRALRDSGLPKSPNSAYALFIQSEAKKHVVNSPTEFIKRAAEKWKALTEKEKMEFENQAHEDKNLYTTEMNVWRTKMEVEGKTNLIKAFEEIKRKTRFSDADELLPIKKLATKKEHKSKIASSKN